MLITYRSHQRGREPRRFSMVTFSARMNTIFPASVSRSTPSPSLYTQRLRILDACFILHFLSAEEGLMLPAPVANILKDFPLFSFLLSPFRVLYVQRIKSLELTFGNCVYTTPFFKCIMPFSSISSYFFFLIHSRGSFNIHLAT